MHAFVLRHVAMCIFMRQDNTAYDIPILCMYNRCTSIFYYLSIIHTVGSADCSAL